MSPLSKAFVVLATLLSVVMVALTVAFAAQTENYRAKYAEAKTDRMIANNAADAKIAAASDEYQDATNALLALQAAENSADATLKAKLGEIRERDERVANLEATNARLSAALAAASETLQAANERSGSQDEQIRGLINELASIARQKSESEQALVAAIGERDRYENDIRRLTEQLRASQVLSDELNRDNERLTILVNDLADSDEVFASVPIAGSVTNVDQVGTDLTLVEINVGTRDSVQANMSFRVTRGDQYVGTIRITTVDTDKAVGEVTLSSDRIRSGDAVRTGD